MKYPLHVIVRKKLSSFINGILSLFTKKTAYQEALLIGLADRYNKLSDK